MKKIALLLSLVLLLCAAQSAKADDACDKFTTSYDKTYCMAKLFLESDKELNDAYKSLKDQVKDEGVKHQLTETQRAWIKYRNSSCEQSGTIDVDCNYDVNRDRTQYLLDRARECKTGDCRNDMIGAQSWK